jgi:hypothetical protein
MVGQLSIGNTVNLGVQLYLQHLKLYLRLSAIAHLWLLLPIYGWAKFLEISASISRLVFAELHGQLEDFSAVQREVYRQKWQLLRIAILVTAWCFLAILLAVILLFLLAIVLSIIVYILYLVNKTIDFRSIGYGIGFFTAILIYLFVPLSSFWVYSRLFIAEMPLLIEDRLRCRQAIKRSWQLTKGVMKHTQGVMAIAFAVSLPILSIAWFSLGRLTGLFLRSLSFEDYYRYANLAFMLYVVVFSLLTGIVTMPFWQAIKAVLYYDLRNVREGMAMPTLSDRAFSDW